MAPAFRSMLGALAALVLASPPAAAQARRPVPAAPPFTLEHALTLNGISSLTWSADGRRLAFVVTAMDTAENTQNQDLWLWERGADVARRLTHHAKNDFSPSFSPGGDTLAFVATRGAGDDAKPAIHFLFLKGGEPVVFGRYDEGVGEVAWSPDGRHLAFVMNDTLPRQVREWRRRKWDQVVEDERLQYPHLWVIEVATGRKRRLTSGERWIWNARWSPDSRAIAFLTSPTGRPDDGNRVDIGVVPVASGPVRTLGVIGQGGFAWSPDGRWIALATGADRAAWVQKDDLYVVPAAGGTPIHLTAAFDGDAGAPWWSPGSDTLYFHAAHGVSTVLVAVPRTGGAPRVVLDREASAGNPAAPLRGGPAAWVHSSPTMPAEVRMAGHIALAGRPVTTLNAAVTALRLGSTRSVTWTSSDGVRVEGLLVRPWNAPASAALPTLVMLHGGPYGSRYALGFHPVPQFLAARGWQVFMPNFRSSGGYGTAFLLRRRADWGGQDWRDVATGVDTLVRRGLADGRRLGVFGHSYGGYLAAWAITQTDRFDAAMVSAGAVDLASHWGQSDIQQYRAWDFEGRPWESREKWERSSPLTHIARAKTPTLIFAGDEDRRVPMPQGQELYRALRARGVPTQFVHYPREPHTYREYPHQWDRWMRTALWFERWIK